MAALENTIGVFLTYSSQRDRRRMQSYVCTGYIYGWVSSFQTDFPPPSCFLGMHSKERERERGVFRFAVLCKTLQLLTTPQTLQLLTKPQTLKLLTKP